MEWQEEAIEALGLKKEKPTEEKNTEKTEEEVKTLPQEEEEEQFEGVDTVEEIPEGKDSEYGI